MRGTGYIIVSMNRPIPGTGQFHEHETIESAQAEAQRLTLQHHSEFVIYEPVLRCVPTPPVQWTDMRPNPDDEIPF